MGQSHREQIRNQNLFEQRQPGETNNVLYLLHDYFFRN